MTRRLAEVAKKVGVSEATVSRVLNGKPGRLRGHPGRGADRARRARLRAAHQAARRARPAGRPGPARAAEPDLPGVRRGRRRARWPSEGSPPCCAPRPPAGSPRPTTSTCCSTSRSPAWSSPAATTPRPTPPHEHYRRLPGAQAAGRAGQRGHRRPRLPAGVRATTRSPSSRRTATCARSATSGSAWCSAPRDHVPSRRKLAALAPRRRRAGAPDEPVERTIFSLEGGQAAATRLLDRGVTGIICACDLLALGAIRAARRAGPAGARRRLGGRLRRLRLHDLHRAAADHRPPADRGDGAGRGRRCWSTQIDRAPRCPPTSCSSSRSWWCAVSTGAARRVCS